MNIKFLGTGKSLPERVVTNDYLSTIVETSHEWIESRTGICERRLVTAESTTSMASAAAKAALEKAAVDPKEIDLIIVATMTPDMNTPSTACQLQACIGAVNAAAYDINAACTGFLYALQMAYAYFAAGIYRTALLVGAETLSGILDWNDRSTCVLFGDGAGAAVVTAQPEGLCEIILHSDGTMGEALACSNREIRNPLTERAMDYGYLSMNGQEVFKFAVKKVPECIQEVLVKAHTAVDEVKFFILHQANRRIITSVAKRLQADPAKFPVDLDRYGNTSAASIPILLEEMDQARQLQAGDKIILCGFGGGLTWGAALIEWV